MSTLSIIKLKLGQAIDATKNFLFDASAQDGTWKLTRESGGTVFSIDQSNTVKFSNNGANLATASQYSLSTTPILLGAKLPISLQAGVKILVTVTVPQVFGDSPNLRAGLVIKANGVQIGAAYSTLGPVNSNAGGTQITARAIYTTTSSGLVEITCEISMLTGTGISFSNANTLTIITAEVVR